jgi:hypothetical protein
MDFLALMPTVPTGPARSSIRDFVPADRGSNLLS